MSLLRSFIPWIAFFVFSIWGYLVLGSASAAFLALLLYAGHLNKIKVFDYVSMLFFLALIIVQKWMQPPLLKEYMPYLGNLFLSAFILISMLVRHPFSIDYAKDVTPKKVWKTPVFLRINMIISFFWLIAFAASIPMIYLSGAKSEWYHAVQAGLFVVAIILSKRFPKWYLKKRFP